MKWIIIPICLLTVSCGTASERDAADTVSITRKELDAQPKTKPAQLLPIILANGKAHHKFKIDEYWLQDTSIKGDTLDVGVTSGGGCKDHVYTLVATRYFLESDPIQANLLLTHNAHNDPCEAIIGADLKFDLTPLKREFKKTSPEDNSGTIRLNIYGANPQEPLKRILYSIEPPE